MLEQWDIEIVFGPGSDCELCGWSRDEMQVHANGDGTYDIYVESGCTGGGSLYDAGPEETVEYLTGWIFASASVQTIIDKITGENGI